MCTNCFNFSGHKIEDSNPDPEMTLLTYLRTKLGLCGTKLGCGEGGCGACTVMISRYINSMKFCFKMPYFGKQKKYNKEMYFYSSIVKNSANQKGDVVQHLSINACLTPVCSLHGMAVTTVEGIGSTKYVILFFTASTTFKHCKLEIL